MSPNDQLKNDFSQRAYSRPAGATELVVVRHGASEAAVPGRQFRLFEGRGDPALSEVGLGQAQAILAHLGDAEFDDVFVSSLRRTQESAAPLAAARGIEPHVLPELSEVGLGLFEGGEYRIRLASGDPVTTRVFAEERWDAIPEAESNDELAKRVGTGIDRIIATVGAGAVALVFAHGGVIGELGRRATDSRPFAFVHTDNGSITRIVVEADGRWLLRSFNETGHLHAGAAANRI